MKGSDPIVSLKSCKTSPAEVCPVTQNQNRIGGRGCGFAFLMQQFHATNSESSSSMAQIRTVEEKALTDLLMPNPPPKHETCSLKNADILNPTDEEVLSAAISGLGVPARAVLTRAELMGPRTGWRDGHLSSLHGFCPPDPSASPVVLAQSPGIRSLTSF